MRNKILILHEAEGPSRALSQKIKTHLGEKWDLEPMEFCLDFSNWGRVKNAVWDFLENDWAGLDGIKRFFQSKLLTVNELEVLDKLRQVQPPIVVATSGSALRIMTSIKSKRLYLGNVAAALPGFSYDDFHASDSDLFVCFNKFQAESLKSAGLRGGKIVCSLPLDPIAPAEITDSGMRELGLFSTMSAIFFRSNGSKAALESYRRLLRAPGSFQIALHVPQSESEKFKSISAPAAHPVKFLSGSVGEYVKVSAAVVLDEAAYEIVEIAAACKKPLIAIGQQDSNQDLSRFVSEGLAAYARVPTETQFLVETVIQGKKLTDTDKLFEYMTNAGSGLPLADGLAQAMPTHELRVSNYQEKDA